MGDVDKFFPKRRHIDGCKFVVAGVSAGSGIGNKALSIISVLVYAVLTQRILLVPLVTAVPSVFCEPFEGSSWTVDPDKDAVWCTPSAVLGRLICTLCLSNNLERGSGFLPKRVMHL